MTAGFPDREIGIVIRMLAPSLEKYRVCRRNVGMYPVLQRFCLAGDSRDEERIGRGMEGSAGICRVRSRVRAGVVVVGAVSIVADSSMVGGCNEDEDDG